MSGYNTTEYKVSSSKVDDYVRNIKRCKDTKNDVFIVKTCLFILLYVSSITNCWVYNYDIIFVEKNLHSSLY